MRVARPAGPGAAAQVRRPLRRLQHLLPRAAEAGLRRAGARAVGCSSTGPSTARSVDACRSRRAPASPRCVPDKAVPEAFYRVAGFHVCGPRAVRIDMLERLADLIRPLVAWRADPAKPDAPPKGATGDGGFQRDAGDDVDPRLLGGRARQRAAGAGLSRRARARRGGGSPARRRTPPEAAAAEAVASRSRCGGRGARRAACQWIRRSHPPLPKPSRVHLRRRPQRRRNPSGRRSGGLGAQGRTASRARRPTRSRAGKPRGSARRPPGARPPRPETGQGRQPDRRERDRQRAARRQRAAGAPRGAAARRSCSRPRPVPRAGVDPEFAVRGAELAQGGAGKARART